MVGKYYNIHLRTPRYPRRKTASPCRKARDILVEVISTMERIMIPHKKQDPAKSTARKARSTRGKARSLVKKGNEVP